MRREPLRHIVHFSELIQQFPGPPCVDSPAHAVPYTAAEHLRAAAVQQGPARQPWHGSAHRGLLAGLPSHSLASLPAIWVCRTCGAAIRLRETIENKDLLFACYSGKTPTGIYEALNSTACCKWNCLLCSVRAGYSQLSLLTQLHERAHPPVIPHCSAHWAQFCFHLSAGINGGKAAPPSPFAPSPKAVRGLEDGESGSGSVPAWRPGCLGPAAAVACSPELQHFKTTELLWVSAGSRIRPLMGQVDALIPGSRALPRSSIQTQPRSLLPTSAHI